MTDFVVTLGSGGGRDYTTFGAVYSAVAAGTITGSSNLVTGTDRVFVDVWADADFVENLICTGVTQDDTYKIVFRQASGSARPKITSSSGVTAWIRDSFVSFENIHFDSTSTSVGDAAIRVGNSGVTPEGNVFVNPLVTTAEAYCARVNNNPVGSATYPITFINPLMRKGTLAGPVFGVSQVFAGTPLNQYLRVVHGTITGGESSFSRRQGDAGSLLRFEIINTVCFGYFGSNAWVIDSTFLGTLDTTGSEGNYSKHASDTLPGLGVPNPVTLTSNTSPAPGSWFIVVDATGHADMRPVDDADNDLLYVADGPTANSLVPTYDFDGNPRSGATTTPGAFELPPTDVPMTVDAVTRGVRTDVGATLALQSNLSLVADATSRVGDRALSVTLASQAALSLLASAPTRVGPRDISVTLSLQSPSTFLASAVVRGVRSVGSPTLTPQSALSLSTSEVTRGSRFIGSTTLTPQSSTFSASEVTRGTREGVGASLATQAALQLNLEAVSRGPRTNFSVDLTNDVLTFASTAPTRASFGLRQSVTLDNGSAQALLGLAAPTRVYRFSLEEDAEVVMSLGTELPMSVDGVLRGVRFIGDAILVVSGPPPRPESVPPTIVQVGGVPRMRATTRRGP
jgi:hypothetical protein